MNICTCTGARCYYAGKSGAEIIAFVTGQDVTDVREMEYRAGRTSVPIYSAADGGMCCPPAGRKPPADRDGTRYNWRPWKIVCGRTIYRYDSQS